MSISLSSWVSTSIILDDHLSRWAFAVCMPRSTPLLFGQTPLETVSPLRGYVPFLLFASRFRGSIPQLQYLSWHRRWLRLPVLSFCLYLFEFLGLRHVFGARIQIAASALLPLRKPVHWPPFPRISAEIQGRRWQGFPRRSDASFYLFVALVGEGESVAVDAGVVDADSSTGAAGGTTSGLKSETRPCSRTHFPPKYAAATNSTAIVLATITGQGFMVCYLRLVRSKIGE